MNETLSDSVQSAYDDFYSDSTREWRELGARLKADNILSVCRGHTFGMVLECGAGEGSILKFLDDAETIRELYAIEISDSGIEKIRQRELNKLREVRKFDGYTIPYPDKHFDMAYCSHVMEHVEHPRLLLRELRRVSKLQLFEVPLDYTVDVDTHVGHFLSYGHINIYTPATFRFLLRSEGYDIINDLLTRTPNEVTRFNWYRNQHQKRNLLRETRLALRPLKRLMKRMMCGSGLYNELTYNAYTCLAKGTGELRIFAPSGTLQDSTRHQTKVQQ